MSAVMGSGKSVLIAEVCASGKGRVVITVPTVALVDQLAATVGARCPGEVGRYYTHAKESGKRITVCCLPSLPMLVAEPGFTSPALWVADEAHKSECATVLDAYAFLKPSTALGFTATPYRTKRTEDLSLWDTCVYEYSAADAFRDGVVVRPRLVHWEGGQVPVDTAAVDLCLKQVGPGLVNAANIDDAEAFAARLTREGLPAAAVHSKQSRESQADTMARLRDGKLRAVVHVNMLSEGVDFPWLQWLCMRRAVGSRVRFCQEVGRILRAHPGKTAATLIDLHDLFDGFGLTYEAMLAGSAAEKGDSQEKPEVDRAAIEIALLKDEVLIKRIVAWRRYLRQLYLAMLSEGVVEQKVAGTSWRALEPSDKQRDAVRHAVAGLLRDTTVPIEHRKALADVAANAQHLKRGDVSDLLSVGFALRDRRKERLPWPLTQPSA